MTSPFVSVIIPTYNRDEFVCKAINSALEQTFKDIEVLVIDDGSTDHTFELIKEYRDPRLTYYYQENKGKGGAINQGLLMSRGTYINKLDSDDWLVKDGIAALVNRILDDPDIDVVSGGYWLTDQDGNAIVEIHPWEMSPELGVKTWLFGCPALWQASMFHRRWVKISGGFDVNISGPDDWDFGLRLASMNCKMEWVKRPVFCYRQHAGMSMNTARNYLHETEYILDKFYHSEEVSKDLKNIKSHVYSEAYMNAAGRLYASGLFTQAQEALIKASLVGQRNKIDTMAWLVDHITWWTASPTMTLQPDKLLENILYNLPSHPQLPGKVPKEQIFHQVNVVRLVQAHLSDNRSSVFRRLINIIIYSTHKIVHRQVLSILVQSVLGERISTKLKRLIKRLSLHHDSVKSEQ